MQGGGSLAYNEHCLITTLLLTADSGSLQLTLDSVVSLVSAGDLLLLDWVVARCQQFLTDNIHLDNVITAARLASLYRMGDLDKLALKYQETQFSDLVSSQVSWPLYSGVDITDDPGLAGAQCGGGDQAGLQ